MPRVSTMPCVAKYLAASLALLGEELGGDFAVAHENSALWQETCVRL
jgi:hypothetical protein